MEVFVKTTTGRDKKRRLTAHGGYSAGLVGNLDLVAAEAAEVADAIADDTADAKVVLFT